MAATRAGQAPTPGGARVPVYQHRGAEGTTPGRGRGPESSFHSRRMGPLSIRVKWS
ncbi:Uncharacterized protein DAT39_023695 [Clarias magur]|uniref:Uncharacterized protein n=1 Tax=Clarias magur TaxID=1594786 RepID=A0A8J4T9G7_CLAMG|nr:Uncharacterized protein DAT39_023695 [Clarias magur]